LGLAGFDVGALVLADLDLRALQPLLELVMLMTAAVATLINQMVMLVIP
jgi:hypothetical protein